MKKLLLFLFLFGQASIFGQALLKEVELNDQINQSTSIVEGKVVAKKSFWNKERNFIYTKNTIEIYKSFKNPTAKIIQIITPGGKVDEYSLTVSNSLELTIGDQGLFMLEPWIKENNASNINYQVFSSVQGFYKYDFKNDLISNPFKKIQGINNEPHLKLIDLNYLKHKDVKFSNSFKGVNSNKVSFSFSPSTVSAGTENEIVITGTGFTGSSTVEFKYASDGGATYISALASQINFISSTELRVQVPSDAGTGVIRVDGVESVDVLNISFAQLNKLESGNALITYLFDQSGTTGGYIWQMFTDFDTNTPAKEAFMRAFNTWICSSKVNWEIGSVTTNDSSVNDGENVIRFDNGSELPVGVLGRCLSWTYECGSPRVSTVIELDMIINDSTSWHFDTTPATGSDYDFESVVLHELGHGHQLAHVIDSNDVMYYGLSNGETRRTLSANDVAGSNFVFSRSSSSVCIWDAMTELECPTASLNSYLFSESIEIYPNPTTNKLLHIRNNSNHKITQIILNDIAGRKIKALPTNGSNDLIEVNLSSISKGIYYLKINSENVSTNKKLILN